MVSSRKNFWCAAVIDRGFRVYHRHLQVEFHFDGHRNLVLQQLVFAFGYCLACFSDGNRFDASRALERLNGFQLYVWRISVSLAKHKVRTTFWRKKNRASHYGSFA
ncbi:hypothetical protein GQ457_17G004670 [Hibiscus cannabinus]